VACERRHKDIAQAQRPGRAARRAAKAVRLPPPADANSMTSPSSGATTPGKNAVTTQADPPARGDPGSAAPALPQRTSGSSLQASPARTTQPLADLDLLHRVLDGLKRL
jgi:hypothetical protein